MSESSRIEPNHESVMIRFSVTELHHLADALRVARMQALEQAEIHPYLSDITRARFIEFAHELENLRERIQAATLAS